MNRVKPIKVNSDDKGNLSVSALEPSKAYIIIPMPQATSGNRMRPRSGVTRYTFTAIYETREEGDADASKAPATQRDRLNAIIAEKKERKQKEKEDKKAVSGIRRTTPTRSVKKPKANP